jgi:CRP-like cAMP-binding protein
MIKTTTLEFQPGDIIIREGDSADFVYTLTSGHAEASQSGIKVGEIYAGEVFGALAAFSGVKRNATVTATRQCSVEATYKDSFITLARRQPDVCVKLIKDMARLISDLNESILVLSTSSARVER